MVLTNGPHLRTHGVGSLFFQVKLKKVFNGTKSPVTALRWVGHGIDFFGPNARKHTPGPRAQGLRCFSGPKQ